MGEMRCGGGEERSFQERSSQERRTEGRCTYDSACEIVESKRHLRDMAVLAANASIRLLPRRRAGDQIILGHCGDSRATFAGIANLALH
jgi:hypothetical protein